MAKVISKFDFPKLIDQLKKNYDIFVPQSKDGEVIFDSVTDATRVVLDYETTVLPPKIYFLPPEEELFKVTNGKVREIRIEKQFIVFGLNLKDLSAIVQLDQIMDKEPGDFFYRKRRDMSTLIAVSDVEVGVPLGGDLILEKISDSNFRAIAITEKGRKILNLDLFQEKKIGAKAKSKKSLSKLDEMLLDSELLSQAVEWSRENYSQIWEKLGKLCIGCGICTYVCPLCYCTTNEDKISFNKSICSRCRKWDACTLPGFAQIGGGHNFRPTQKERYFNWFYHKFVRAYKEFGQAQCVACGRCQKYCPAGIDIEKVLEEILIEFKKANSKREF